MTTLGLRGVLACAFIVSSGLLAGMGALPSGAAPSEPYSSRTDRPERFGPSLVDRLKRKACQISLAANGSDRSGSRDRSRQCGG